MSVHDATTKSVAMSSQAPDLTESFVVDVQTAQSALGTRYEVLRLAGAGGMGSVFAARDPLLDRTVALKFSRSVRVESQDQMVRERLLAEARAMAGLRHPNICRVIEVQIDAPVPYLVMEWAEGAHLTDAARSLPMSRRLRLFEHVCSAIASAHQASIAHRDLKPQNILVDGRGEPVVVDFGLALRSETGAPGLTLAGTPGYSPPAQMEGKTEDWFRADVFSLGVILYEVLTGRRPFEGATLAEIARLVREGGVTLPDECAPETPEAVQRICLKALEANPAERYSSATEMLQDLDRFFRGETVAARPTQLAGRFLESIQQQIMNARAWRKHGLVTDLECDRLVNILTDLQRPESPWVVDSRKLSLAQVSLYAGAWMVLLSVTVGMGIAWQELSRSWLVAGAFSGSALLLVLGFSLRRHGRELAGIVHLLAAATVTPVAVWLLLRNGGWLADSQPEASFFAWAFGQDTPPDGLSGLQLLLSSAVWCAACGVLRLMTRAAVFTWFGSLAACLLWFSLWACSGLFVYHQHGGERSIWAGISLWMLAGGGVVLAPVVRLGWHEEQWSEHRGPSRRRPLDSGPLLAMSLFSIVGGLTGIAWFRPEWAGIPAAVVDSSRTMRHAIAFMMSGVVQQVISFVLVLRPWRAGSRGASFLRWLVPNHFCGSLLYLHVDATRGEGSDLLWLVVLAAAAMCFIGLSVVRQWKPFLLSGLGYLTAAYVRGFVSVDQHFPSSQDSGDQRLFWQAVLVAGAMGLGLIVMLLAWAFPDVHQGLRTMRGPLARLRSLTRIGSGRGVDKAAGP